MAVAELLSEWIKCVLQASQPWISTRDIDKGATWFSEISDQLKDTAAGIICLTKENKDRPWILFETGALAKGLSTSKVCTFLVDLESTDVENPLASFNHTFPNKTSMWGLVRSLNSALGTAKLEERILFKVFETYWPIFETDFELALSATPDAVGIEPRSESSILSEILSNTRSLSNRVNDMENKFALSDSPVPYALVPNAKEHIYELLKHGLPMATVNEVAMRFGIDRQEVQMIIRRLRTRSIFDEMNERAVDGKKEVD